jgi:hypothetical protein
LGFVQIAMVGLFFDMALGYFLISLYEKVIAVINIQYGSPVFM